MVVTVKQQVRQILDELPDDCTLEDVQYKLYVIEKIRRRIEMADRGPLLTHEDAQKRVEQWLK